jgi:hypothetical protein
MHNRKAIEHIMSNVRLRRQVKQLKRVAVVASMALLFSGCVVSNPNGFRLTASLGAEQVQEHSETYSVKQSDKPYLCSWINIGSLCGSPEVPQDLK